jgi:carnosine N-methyltransferase
VEKARSTLRQFYRDWSAEGATEREASLTPIINDLQAERLNRGAGSMSVLVPGAGLGRLVYELYNRGYNVEGNEISYHQLLASSYILNYCSGVRIHTVYPWVHSFSNHIKRSHHLQSVQVPDVQPTAGEMVREGTSRNLRGEMSMSASDFILLYENEENHERFDAVATLFFLDTAPNPIRYIQTIHNCLKSGGIWTNLGPLLWHFENSPPGKHGRHTESSTDPESDGKKTHLKEGNLSFTD